MYSSRLLDSLNSEGAWGKKVRIVRALDKPIDLTEATFRTDVSTVELSGRASRTGYTYGEFRGVLNAYCLAQGRSLGQAGALQEEVFLLIGNQRLPLVQVEHFDQEIHLKGCIEQM